MTLFRPNMPAPGVPYPSTNMWPDWISETMDRLLGIPNAVADGNADDTVPVLAALEAAANIERMTVVDLRGKVYRVTQPLRIKSRVRLVNGTIINNHLTAGQAGIYMGVASGGSLVRPAGVDNVYFETTSTAAGIAGFRMDTLVRSSHFKNCFAQMNEDSSGTRSQMAFEIISTQSGDATTGGVGAYENLIENCTAYNAHTGFKVHTRNYTNDPQANANTIRDCNAYACVVSGLILGEGAQENQCTVRADTFTCTTGINVVDIYGKYNYVKVTEEVGTTASGTQYTVRFRNGSAYNHVDYHTQQVVTAAVLDENTDVSKNTTRFFTQLDSFGGLADSFNHYTYTVVGTSVTQELRDIWTAPRKCVVVGVVVKLDTAVGGGSFFHAYAAKNGDFNVNNRIDFAPGEGTTAKELVIDASASTVINSRWSLVKGDQLYIGFSNGTAGPMKASITVIVKYVE